MYVVLGARGGTGCEIVHRLAELPSSDVAEIRAVVRDPSKVHPGELPEDPRVKLVAGDVSQPDSLRQPLDGAHGVFFAAAGRNHEQAQSVDQNGVANVAELGKQVGVQRVVLVSSQLVHPINKWSFIRGILNTVVTGLFHRRGLMDFKFEGEQLLRHSGQEYCIVRPGRLIDMHPGHEKRLGRAVCSVGQCNSSFMRGAATARADVAAVCVAAMTAAGSRNTTFELASEPVDKEHLDVPLPIKELFNKLDPEWDMTWEERIVDKRWSMVSTTKGADDESVTAGLA